MGSPIASEEVRAYFAGLLNQVEATYAVARAARTRGYDPELDVEIPLTDDLASRVERLLEHYEVEGVARRIRELPKTHDREELAILVAKEMALRPATSKEKAVERAVRVGLALLTEGILLAPLEGLAGVKLNRIRGGARAVIAGGMGLKAPKIRQHLKNRRSDGGEFIDECLAQKRPRPEDTKDELGVEPGDVFIQSIVPGGPVLCHPSRPGGLR